MKYLLPKSLTWWASLVPLALGVFVATGDLHGLSAWVDAVGQMTGGASAFALINAGLVGIGLRAAVR